MPSCKYFSTLLIYHFHIYEPHPDLESSYFFMVASLNTTSGGIIFTSPITQAKNFKDNSTIRDYLMMTGYGFMLFFSASQATLSATAYPPFGFATISFYGLGSYLILIGLYCLHYLSRMTNYETILKSLRCKSRDSYIV